tara:strand:- start:1103 stop:1330 length:228 start_codon:yes stop_codon:yes gene_type:complete
MTDPRLDDPKSWDLSKPWWSSKAIWGGFATLGSLCTAGYLAFKGGDVNAIYALLTAAAATCYQMYGRIVAKGPIQ